MEYTPIDNIEKSKDRYSEQLSTLSITELEKVVEKYPWFSLARREIFLRMILLGDEYRKEAVKKASVYLFTREGLLKDENLHLSPKEKFDSSPENGSQNYIYELEGDPIKAETATIVKKEDKKTDEKIEIPSAKTHSVHIIGGDYFGKDDFEALQRDGLTPIERIKEKTLQTKYDSVQVNETATGFTDERFYTETLAKIYTQQGFYDRAIEVYEKLILLYPEKNTYFAALIEELKKHL